MKTRMMVVVFFCSVVVLLSASNVSVARQGRGHHRLGIFHGRHHGGSHHGKYHRKGGDISAHLYDVTGADSLQRIKMKPLVDDAARKIETLHSNYRDQETRVMDSLKTQLKPLLKEDQIKKLDGVRGYKRK